MSLTQEEIEFRTAEFVASTLIDFCRTLVRQEDEEGLDIGERVRVFADMPYEQLEHMAMA